MLDAIRKARATGFDDGYPYDFLPDFPYEVVMAKMEELDDRDIIGCGVSLRTAWIWAEL